MEVPKVVRGKYLVKEYPNFALYIDPETKIRECWGYFDILPRIQMAEVHTARHTFKIKGKKERRKI